MPLSPKVKAGLIVASCGFCWQLMQEKSESAIQEALIAAVCFGCTVGGATETYKHLNQAANLAKIRRAPAQQQVAPQQNQVAPQGRGAGRGVGRRAGFVSLVSKSGQEQTIIFECSPRKEIKKQQQQRDIRDIKDIEYEQYCQDFNLVDC